MVLLLDEPTSGLDSTTALKIVRVLKREAQQKQLTLISTIHQPSSEIFHEFDKVIVLSHKGRLIYNDIPSQAIEFIQGI